MSGNTFSQGTKYGMATAETAPRANGSTAIYLTVSSRDGDQEYSIPMSIEGAEAVAAILRQAIEYIKAAK